MMDQAQKLRSIVSEKHDTALPKTNSRLITVTSGKGGVGKTNFTINLAIQLRKQNYNVVIVDTDFALANVEVLFGVSPKYSIADVLNGSMLITEVLTNGPMGIKFISGGTGIKELVKLNDGQMQNLISNFALLDDYADVIIVDTGAGVTPNVTNFVKASKEIIVVTTPEPTSITDAYTLIKLLKTDISIQIPEIKLIVNRVEDDNEGREIYGKLKNVSSKFLGVDIEFLGVLPYDNLLVKAVKKQEPVSIAYPNSKFTRSIESICEKLTIQTTLPQDGNESGFSGFLKRLVKLFNNQ